MTDPLTFLRYQGTEHDAWLAVVKEAREHGLDFDGNAERLHAAIARWGEELVELRANDPDPNHRFVALRERRASYPIPDQP